MSIPAKVISKFKQWQTNINFDLQNLLASLWEVLRCHVQRLEGERERERKSFRNSLMIMTYSVPKTCIHVLALVVLQHVHVYTYSVHRL